MKGIPNTERQRLGALLDHETQETVMAMIPQFSETEIGAPVPAPAEVPEELGLLVFNMERGVHLEELGDFLQDCPGVRPLDVVLANELDDGCVRSGGRNTARELAERFGWNYAYGLEFIELVNGEDPRASTEMRCSPAGPSGGRGPCGCRSSTTGTSTASAGLAGDAR